MTSSFNLRWSTPPPGVSWDTNTLSWPQQMCWLLGPNNTYLQLYRESVKSCPQPYGKQCKFGFNHFTDLYLRKYPDSDGNGDAPLPSFLKES